MTLHHLLPICLLGFASFSIAADSDWRYGLPDTGLTPSAFDYEVLTRANERDGGSAFGMQKLGVSVPLSDPRKSGYQRWLFSAELDATIAELSTGGLIQLEEETMYTLNVPLALVRSYESGNRLTLALVPTLASDMGNVSGAFSVGAMVNYRVVSSETFSYSYGLAYSERYDRNGIFPMINFNWDITPEWTLSLSRFDLALEYHFSDRFKLGPYAGIMSNSWTIHPDDGDYWLRTQSVIVGLKGQFNVDSTGKAKKVLDFGIGASVYTRLKLEEHTWRQDTVAKEYYEPALYVSLGFDMRF